jgi:hypothetical protein
MRASLLWQLHTQCEARNRIVAMHCPPTNCRSIIHRRHHPDIRGALHLVVRIRLLLHTAAMQLVRGQALSAQHNGRTGSAR